MFSSGERVDLPERIRGAIDTLFRSNTQAFREGLVGCIIARFQDRTINIRLPYAKHGDTAYNGRSLDENAVNPFLVRRRVPCSSAPFLSALRRGIKFEQATSIGLRDQDAWRDLLAVIGYLEETSEDSTILAVLDEVLWKFAELREVSVVRVSRLQRISLDQWSWLLDRLLGSRSGGRFPVLITTALLQTISDAHSLGWSIDVVGINVADAAAGSPGDITVSKDGKIVFVVEVTEREVGGTRVESTFHTKIAPSGVRDYIFIGTGADATDEARRRTHQFFSQGHDINFIDLDDWARMILATLGRSGREYFTERMLGLLESVNSTKPMKIAWNDAIAAIVSSVTLR